MNGSYSKAVVYVNGSLLTEESYVTIKRKNESIAVKTVAKGYAGESPGNPMTMITVRNAVPSVDFEFNPGLNIDRFEEVEVSVFAAGKTLTVVGAIIDHNFDDVAKELSNLLRFDFRGGQGIES